MSYLKKNGLQLYMYVYQITVDNIDHYMGHYIYGRWFPKQKVYSTNKKAIKYHYSSNVYSATGSNASPNGGKTVLSMTNNVV